MAVIPIRKVTSRPHGGGTALSKFHDRGTLPHANLGGRRVDKPPTPGEKIVPNIIGHSQTYWHAA